VSAVEWLLCGYNVVLSVLFGVVVYQRDTAQDEAHDLRVALRSKP
jgi:hypothetical protein